MARFKIYFKVCIDALADAQKRHGLVTNAEAAVACCVLMLDRQMSEFNERMMII